MRRKLFSLLLCVFVVAALLPLAAQTAHAEDYDHIISYDVEVTPNTQDGSLLIKNTFHWLPLVDLDGEYVEGESGVKVGIPNGSLRDMRALTSNISDIEYDNSYAYISFNRDYSANEEFVFSMSWVQEYMYSLDGGSVVYDFTPAWFDSITVDRLTVTWHDPASVQGVASMGETVDGAHTFTVEQLGYGESANIVLTYANWPTALDSQYSKDEMPDDYRGEYYDYYQQDDGMDFIIGIIVFIVILFVVMRIIIAASSYAGGFGTRYVYVGGLWYPRGPDGHPRPGSVGTKTRPAPPSGGGGFGGGSRGGGFGGGGFGGGGHCACASSCACACACACAGGGRAGCSAKNLYGAIHLDENTSQQIKNKSL